MWVAATSSNVIHAAIFQLSCPLELGLSRATSLDNPSVQPQGLRECSGAGANELQPAHLGQHTHTHTQLRKHMQAHARTCTHTHAHAPHTHAHSHVHAQRWSAQHAQAGHFSDHTSQAAIFKSVLHMGNHCRAQPLCHRQAENVPIPKGHQVFVYPRQAVWTVPGQNSGSPRVSSATSSLKHSVTTWTKKRTKSGCRPLRGRPRHHHWISKCLRCSFLHLVTCWHQNLTHALRKMLSGVRCDAQA